MADLIEAAVVPCSARSRSPPTHDDMVQESELTLDSWRSAEVQVVADTTSVDDSMSSSASPPRAGRVAAAVIALQSGVALRQGAIPG